MTIAIKLTAQQAEALAQKARQLRVSETDLAAAAVRDLVSLDNADFEAAATRVLNRNQELYRRLA